MLPLPYRGDQNLDQLCEHKHPEDWRHAEREDGTPFGCRAVAAAALVQESGGPAALHEFEKFTPASQSLKSDATKAGAASADENEDSAVASDRSGTPATCKRYFPHVGVTITVPCD